MSNPPTDKLLDLRIAHLSIIQGLTSRMSGFSAGPLDRLLIVSSSASGPEGPSARTVVGFFEAPKAA